MLAGGVFAPALASPTALVNPLGAALGNPWQYGLNPAVAVAAGGPGGAPGGPGDPFRMLTTCSWEQSDTMVKVYVPLRGVQTDMLCPTFTPNSVEVRTRAGHSLFPDRPGCGQIRVHNNVNTQHQLLTGHLVI